jgi:hypothetical protein
VKPLSKTFLIGLAFAWGGMVSASGVVDLANGLIGHWSFDEGNGSTAVNSGTTGSTHNATLSNGAAFSITEKKLGAAALYVPTGSAGAYAKVTNSLDLSGTDTTATFTISVQEIVSQWLMAHLDEGFQQGAPLYNKGLLE